LGGNVLSLIIFCGVGLGGGPRAPPPPLATPLAVGNWHDVGSADRCIQL